MNQQFDQEPSPRNQRMTESEAKAVIALWQQEEIERGGLTSHPSVSDVAEGLEVSVEDVQRLLNQVRARRQSQQHQRNDSNALLVAAQQAVAARQALPRLEIAALLAAYVVVLSQFFSALIGVK